MDDLVKKWKEHGDYANGYVDAFNGHGFNPNGCDFEPYQVGWNAGSRASYMFTNLGFSHSSDGLSVSFKIGGD